MFNSSEDVAMNKLYTEDDAACVDFTMALWKYKPFIVYEN